jgi:2-iminobutanoate/2-iminopropanoate deaminase
MGPPTGRGRCRPVSERRSLRIEGLSHLTGIPVGTRIGPLLVSSVIAPFDPGTRHVPDDFDRQISNIFRHALLILRDGGGDWSHVAKMEFWAPTDEAREAIERAWIATFPNPESRPSRHTHTTRSAAVTASFSAYVEFEGEGAS